MVGGCGGARGVPGVPSQGCCRQVLLFLFLACAGLYLMLQVPVGLDQELAMPKVGLAPGEPHPGVLGALGHPGAAGCPGVGTGGVVWLL